MKIKFDDKNTQGFIEGDELLLSKIEGQSLDNVKVSAEYSHLNASKLVKAYDKAARSPHQVVAGVEKPFENVKLYAVLRTKFLKSFE